MFMKKHYLLGATLTAVGCFCAPQMVNAAPGDLDRTFGSGGRLLTRYPIDSGTFRP